MRQLKIMTCALCAVALTLTGCTAAPHAAEHRGPVIGADRFVGNQGGSWEVLFNPDPQAAVAGDERSRRNGALALHEPRPITEAGMWPDPTHPRLHEARRLFLPRRPEHIIYLRTPSYPERVRPWRTWH